MNNLVSKYVFAFLYSLYFLLPNSANAALITMEPGVSRMIASSGISVAIYPRASLRLPDGRTSPLVLTGAGIYNKQIIFATVPVYVAVHYTELLAGLDSSNPMRSIKQAKFKAMQLTSLTEMSSGEIRIAFEDALSANGIDLDDPGVHEALTKLVFNARRGDVATLVGFGKEGTNQSIALEFKEQLTTTTAPSLADIFWRVWFDVPLDNGIAKLKRALVSGH